MADFIEVPDWARPPGSTPQPAAPPTHPTAPPTHPAPLAASPAPSAPASTWHFQLPGFNPVPVRGTGLIGRDPEPAAGETVEHLLAVGAHELSVSKTHVAFGVDGAGFWVVDRHSTNGVAVDGVSIPPGELVHVASGQRVRFGDLEFTASLA